MGAKTVSLEGLSPRVCAGTAVKQKQQPAHRMESFEDLDLSHANAGDERKARQPLAASILLSWQPEGVPLPLPCRRVLALFQQYYTSQR